MGINIKNLQLRNEPILFLILGLILTDFLGHSIYWCYLTVPFVLFSSRNNLDIFKSNLFLIFSFSILYFTCLLINRSPDSNAILVGYLFFPSTFYFIGRYLIKAYPNYNTVFFTFFLLASLFSILPFIANIISVNQSGFMTERNIRLIWSNQSEITRATIVGSYFALGLSLFPILLIKTELPNMAFYKIWAALLLSSALFATFNMSNRTGLLILFTTFLAYLYTADKKFKVWTFITLLFILTAISYQNDIFHVQSWFESTQYYERLSGSTLTDDGSRIILWEKAMGRLAENPTGETDYSIKADYAHNLWLDCGLKAGMIPMIFLIIISIVAIITIYKVTSKVRNDEFLRYLIIGFGLAFFITFMLEPILEGYQILFYMFFLYFGIVDGISKQFK